MSNRQHTRPARAGERGAALVVAIAIMTILLAVALTFYAVSRQEAENSTLVRNQVQSGLLEDSALAIAMAKLNAEFLNNPNATSLDSEPFSWFNGSAFVGKNFALRNGVPLQQGGVPLVDLDIMPDVQFPDGYVEQLYNGSRTRRWLAIPRIEGATPYLYDPSAVDLGNGIATAPFSLADRNRPPFVTPAFYGPGFADANNDGTFGLESERYPIEFIHSWADVDNDGDGFHDAIWIPIPQDRYFSGGEVVNEVNGRRMYDDGIDNDLDGSGARLYDELPEAGEGAMELGTFVYNGAKDGLDNDGDGQTDELDEDKLFLTAPLPGLTIPVDMNADGKVPDLVPDATGVLVPLRVTLPNTIRVQTELGPVDLTSLDVDAIDNDYDMLVNDYHVYAFVGPNTNDQSVEPLPPFQLRGFSDSGVPNVAVPGRNLIKVEVNVSPNSSLAVNDPYYTTTWRHPDVWAPDDVGLFSTALLKSYDDINFPLVMNPVGGLTISPANALFQSAPGVDSTFDYTRILPFLRVTVSGEPVCDLAGRAAITIRDEAGKLNLNVAGGHHYDATLPVLPDLQTSQQFGRLVPALYRSLGQGATPYEMETRALPGVGVVQAAQLWAQRTGLPGGNPAGWDASVPGLYGSDVIYPGYGRTDDNGNVLVSALNARDDDGDGLVDEGLFLPEISALAEGYLRGAPLSAADITRAQAELAQTRYVDYYAQLGVFEGVDEPAELQRYGALPNLLAEGRSPYNLTVVDSFDNDRDGAINELGELGDLQLQDNLQLQDIFGVGPGTYNTLKNLTTTFSTDRNVNFVSGLSGIRAIGKLNYNFATPQQIAANFLMTSGYQSVTAAPVASVSAANDFAEGLRQADVHIRSSIPPGGGTGGLMGQTVPFFPADPVLQAMQAAVDIVDNRDVGHARSMLTTERQRLAGLTPEEGVSFDYYPARLGVRERIADTAIFPLGVLEDHLRNTLALNRKLEITDDWWSGVAGVTGESGARPEVRQISYTTTGNEAIKINELMVRAVRRVEAEAVPNPAGVFGVGDPMTPPINAPVPTPITNFDPSPDFGDPASPSILPEFEIGRLTTPALAGWGLVNGGVLGDASYLGITVNGADATSLTNGADILEFVISATDGLPPGRYYLTINTTTNTGAPTVVPIGQLPTPLAAANEPILQSAVKYVSKTSAVQPGDTIIEDVANGLLVFQNIDNPQIGGSIPGAPAGWVFVDGTRGGYGTAENYNFDGVDARVSTSGQETFTITVPEDASDFELHIAFRLNPNFVAALDVTDLTYGVAINALDFSQEPDHEWVELINTSDETVNVGGWTLEVGIPERPSVPADPFKTIWTIPANTQVAPRGMLLLAFNKFDTFQGGTNAHRFADNGMGLADGNSPNPLLTAAFLTGNLTLPPISDNSLGSTVPALQDLTGSVFRRLTNPATGFITDYVDWDGDGRTALNAPGDTDNLVNEIAVVSTSFLGTVISNSNGNLPWDRIVQLESSQVGMRNPFTSSPTAIALDEVDTLDDVSAVVLKGGFLPNYPERDGVDNDGDGGYLRFEQIDERTQNPLVPYDVGTGIPDGIADWIDASQVPGVPVQYIPGTLDMDMVDNDFDGFIDERPYTADFFGIGVNSVFYRASLSEGVDEGRGLYGNTLAIRRYGAGSFESGVLPLGVFANRLGWNNAYATGVVNPPLTVNSVTPSGLGLQHGINTGFTIFGDPSVIPAAIPLPYQGTNIDPLDWKVFQERRWYPGDNVIVTLYQGVATEENVVDRVTYREFDVINRTNDDVAPIPYASVDLDGSGTPGDSLIEYPGLNPLYPSLWLPDHMGLDFYRSLERKHPHYNGDRFGTENRWQATDGNYDDWADSLSFFEAEIQSPNAASVGGTEPLEIADRTLQDIRPRFVGTHTSFPNVDADTIRRNQQLFQHAISGSPLRMNTVMRRGENPRDLELIAAAALDTRQFPSRPGYLGPFDYFRTHEDGAFDGTDPLKTGIRIPGEITTNTKSLPDQRWNLSRAQVVNAPYQNPGDLMRVPHQVYLHDAVAPSPTPTNFLRDMTLVNHHLQGNSGIGDGVSVTQDITLRGATLGQDMVDDGYAEDLLSVAINTMAVDSTVLTMGQAELRPIRPGALSTAEVSWVPNPGASAPPPGFAQADLLAPAAWAPVFLFEFPSDSSSRRDTNLFPNYPDFADGTPSGIASIQLNYLFNSDYLTNVLNFGGVNPYNNVSLDSRWPLETRTAMYVSEKRAGIAPPEALFIWDGADGLENGEYVVYIGTFLPQMRDRLDEAARATAQVRTTPAVNVAAKNEPRLLHQGGTIVTNYELEDGSVIPVNVVTHSILTRDPTSPRTDKQGRNFKPSYAIDVITDPTEARGVAPRTGTTANPAVKPGGLIHPDDWNPSVQYRPGSDGYIAFGNNSSGGWQPQIVRVTDNFLAIRVRNVGAEGELGVLSHVVLAPRKRTAGRVNVNTAEPRVQAAGNPHQYYNTLLGLPGVVNAAQYVIPTGGTNSVGAPIPPDEDIGYLAGAPRALDGGWASPGGPTGFYPAGPTPPTRNRFTGDVLNPDSDLLVPNLSTLTQMERHLYGAFRLSALMQTGRTEHADGRYYETLGDLTQDANGYDYNYLESRMDLPDLTGTGTDGVEDWAVYPLSNDANPARRFDEVQARMRTFGNLLTVRSDVFEILMTVESGYGIDRNNDGFINYRDPNEFVTTGASKASATYERPAPSESTDTGE